MAFVPQYEYEIDIFVSYAHVDDLPEPATNTRWVTTLVQGLEAYLARQLGRSDAFTLWMDHELPGHVPLTSEIMAKLHNSATMLLIWSPGYVASAWCQRELNVFLGILRARPYAHSSVFIIECGPRGREQQPPALQDLPGYRFWVEDRPGRALRILGFPQPNPADMRYYDLLGDLSTDLAKTLQGLKNAATRPEPIPPAPEQDVDGAVFLAEVTNDLDSQRDAVRRYLVQAGLHVLPEPWYSREPSALQHALDTDLARSALFVQLLSEVQPQGSAHLQYERARALGKPIVQWRSPALDLTTVQDKDYRAFLERETVLATRIEELERTIIEELERPIVQRILVEQGVVRAISPSPIGHTPYPGLRPFRSDETGIFFGRESQVDTLLEKLDQDRFLTVVGPSGCGKSSLARAGMIPALERGGLARAGGHWQVAAMRPGERPLRRLAEALLAASVLGPEDSQVPGAVDFLYAMLRRGPLGLVEVLGKTLLPKETNLLLLVDQFEEIFRYRQPDDSDETDAFVALLLASAAQRDVPVYVVITMRADFLEDCAVFHGLPEAINRGQFLTPRLTREQRREAIIKPAMVFGGQIEPVLVNRLLNDTGEESDQLPLLQHVLMRMWTRVSVAVEAHNATSQGDETVPGAATHAAGVMLTLDNYEHVGGLANALSRHADEAYEELDAEQQRIAEVLFRCLSERSLERRDTRRPVRLRTVAAVADVSPAQVAAVADVFRRADRNFITPSADVVLHPDTLLDMSHESLIRQWQRVNEWAEQEAKSVETYLHLAQTSRLWQCGHAGLLGTLDLETALAWKARERPTPAWAERYGQDFQFTMDFIDASERQWHEKLRIEEEELGTKLKQARRQLALALLGLCIAVALALWAGWERQRAEEAKNATEQARAQAEQSRLGAIVQALVAQRPDERGALLVRQAYLFNARAHGHALHQIDAALRTVLNTSYFSHTLHFPNAARISKSADAKTLVVADKDGTLRLWDLRQLNATPTVLQGPENPHLHLHSLSPDGSALAMLSIDPTVMLSIDPTKIDTDGFGGQVVVWDLRQPQATPTGLGDNKKQFSDVAFSPDGQTLAAALMPDLQRIISSGWQSRVLLWDWQRPGTAPTVLDIPGSFAVRRMAFGPDSQILATLSPEFSSLVTARKAGTLRLWDLRHLAAAPKVIGGAEDLVVGLEFSADGDTLATRHTTFPNRAIWGDDLQKRAWEDLGSTIQVRDLRQSTAKPIMLHSPSALFSSMALSPDGQTLATGDNIGSVRLWALRQPAVTPTVLGTQEGQVQELMFSPDGHTLIAQDEVNTLRVWELHQSPPTFTVLRSHTDAVSSLAFSPDGNTLVSGSKDHTVRLWDLRQPAATPTVLSDYNAPVLAVALSPDGQWLATGGLLKAWSAMTGNFGDAVWLWDLRQSPPARTVLSEPGGPGGSVAFSPDGQWLAATIANLSGSVRLWDLHQPASDPITLDIPGFVTIAATFSPDGQRLAISSMGGLIRLWGIQQRKEVTSLPVGSTTLALSVAFSPDGQWFAAGSDDGTVRLWDLRRPEANPTVLSGDGVPVYAVAFSPDSQRLAAGSFNNVARLWNLHQLEAAPIVLRGHEGPVFTVAFSPDGQRLATGSHDQTIRLWHVHTVDLANQVCERVWRNLTLDEWRQFIGADLPYERACPNLPLHPSVLAESERLVRAGDVAGAVAFLQRIREHDPAVELNPHKQVAQALVAHGKALAKAGNLDGAHALLAQAHRLDPTVELPHVATTPQ